MTFEKIKSILLKNTSTKQTIAKNTFWLFFGNMTSRFIRAGLLIYAARILGAHDWGAFNYAMGIAAFFTMFTDFGVNAVLTRESAKDTSVQEKYFSSAFFTKIILSLATIVILFLIFPILSGIVSGKTEDPQLVLSLLPIVIFLVIFDTLRDFGATLSRAWEKMEVEGLIQIITNIMIVAIGFFALYLSPTPKSLAIGYAIGTGIGMVASFWPFRRYFKNFWKTISIHLSKKILSSGWVFGMMGIIGAIMLNTDSVMIGWLVGLDGVGYYGAGQRFVQMIYIIPGLIATAFFPTLTKLIKEKGIFESIFNKQLSLLMTIALPLTVGGVILAGLIFRFLYGTQYDPGIISFLLLNITYLSTFIATPLGNIIFALEKEKILFKYVLIGGIGNIILNLVFIPIFGIAGSALSTVLNQIIGMVYLYLKIRGSVKINIFTCGWKPFVAVSLMGLLSYGMVLLNVNLIINIILSSIVYFVFLIITKQNDAKEIWNLAITKMRV